MKGPGPLVSWDFSEPAIPGFAECLESGSERALYSSPQNRQVSGCSGWRICELTGLWIGELKR